MTTNPNETSATAKRAVIITLSVVATLLAIALVGVSGVSLWSKVTAETASEKYRREHPAEVAAEDAATQRVVDSVKAAPDSTIKAEQQRR